MQRKLRLSLIILLLVLAWSVPAVSESRQQPDKICFYSCRIVQSYPHDPKAFTQGLVIDKGVLFESTGLNGRSSLRRVDLSSGKVSQLFQLPSQFFGEGITVLGSRIIQLTWKSGFGFVYDKDSFNLLRVFSYAGEGWGITTDGRSLIISDGTATLRFVDPETFAENGRIEVRDNKGPVVKLNELEFVNGEVYANVWQTERIAIIDPQTGWVKGWIDASGLLAKVNYAGHADVLNGIAYDRQKHQLFVTGKLWPRLFQIELVVKKRK